MYDFSPALCFYESITVYYKVSIVPFHQEGNILWTLNFPARTPAAFSSTRTPRPSPNASASPANRSAARAAASRSTRSSRCLSAQSSSTCRCPPSTCMPKSSTVSCCCFASRTASARSSPPGFQGTGAKGYFTFVKKQCTVPFIVMALMIVTALVGALTSWVVLRPRTISAAADRQRQLCKRN